MNQSCLSNDELFARIAIGGGFLDEGQVKQAKMLQKLVLKRSGKQVTLGKILAALGELDKQKLDTIIRMQKAMECGITGQGSEESAVDPVAETKAPDFELIIDSDHMQARIKVPAGNPGKIDLQKVKKELAANSIVFGVLDDQAIQQYLDDSRQDQALVVARGKEPVPGDPPEIVYHFDTDPLRIGTLKQDGTMDWKDRGSLPQVKPGDLLAEKITSDPGKAGTDILGRPVPPPRIKDVVLKCGRGVERSADGTKALAKIGGSPRIGPDGKLMVMATYVIDGDVGLETGHVNFNGLIDVKGTVLTGFKVEGQSLRAGEIQGAEIKLEGDLVCYKGIYGARISIGGKLRASHVHDSKILAVGDMVVEREIFDSDIEVNGRCVIGGGNIVASKVSAKKGIQTMDVGTEAAKPSHLTVGVDKILERKLNENKQRLADLEKLRSDLELEVSALSREYDQVGTELGEVAQEQDRCMVEKRELEEQVKAENKDGKKVENTVLEKIESLETRYHELDDQVAVLMDREDHFKDQISEKKRLLEELVQEKGQIQRRLDKLLRKRKEDQGVPIIKVAGTIFSKTGIQGPHSNLVLAEGQQHVRIAEVREGGSGKMSIYGFKITPLR